MKIYDPLGPVSGPDTCVYVCTMDNIKLRNVGPAGSSQVCVTTNLMPTLHWCTLVLYTPDQVDRQYKQTQVKLQLKLPSNYYSNQLLFITTLMTFV